MSKPNHFEIMEDHAVFRPTGQLSLEQTVQLVMSAIAYARDNQIRKLMVVSTDLGGFEPPALASRYFFVRDWARAAERKVCVAVVARPEMIDFEKIGTIIAKNAGLHLGVFESEEEALTWLQTIK